MRGALLTSLLGALICLGYPPAVWGQSIPTTATWQGGVGNWTTPAWIMVPPPIIIGDPDLYQDDGFFGCCAFFVQTSIGGEGSSILLDIPVGISQLTIFDSDTLTIGGSGGSLTIGSLSGGSVINDGHIVLDGNGQLSGAAFGGLLNLTRTGTITLRGDNTALGAVLNSLVTIGGGRFDLNGSVMIHGGVVQALGSGEVRSIGGLNVIHGPTDLNGLIHVTAGSLGFNAGSFDLQNAELRVDAGALAQATSTPTFVGGLLSGSGQFDLLSSTDFVPTGGMAIQDLTVRVAHAVQLRLLGNLTNSGSLLLDAANNAANTDLRIVGDVTLDGGGELRMSDATTNRIFGWDGTERLTNLDNRISGAGQLGVNFMSFTNQHIIDADLSQPLTINPNGNDFLIWQTHFGQSNLSQDEGDANGDSNVNGQDLLVWKTQFGSGVGAAGNAQTVPKPNASLLMLLTVSSVVSHRRRTRACP